MPLETKSRVRAPLRPGLDLPPPFRLIMLREAGDAFAHARAIAAAEGAEKEMAGGAAQADQGAGGPERARAVLLQHQ